MWGFFMPFILWNQSNQDFRVSKDKYEARIKQENYKMVYQDE